MTNSSSKFTPEEDAKILKAVNKQKYTKVTDEGEQIMWSKIAHELLPHYDHRAVRQRYRRVLDPRISKEDWSASEDAKLLKLAEEHEKSWSKVSEDFGFTRSDTQCRNRFIKLSGDNQVVQRRARKSKPKKKTTKKRSTGAAKKKNSVVKLMDDSSEEEYDEDSSCKSRAKRSNAKPLPKQDEEELLAEIVAEVKEEKSKLSTSVKKRTRHVTIEEKEEVVEKSPPKRHKPRLEQLSDDEDSSQDNTRTNVQCEESKPADASQKEASQHSAHFEDSFPASSEECDYYNPFTNEFHLSNIFENDINWNLNPQEDGSTKQKSKGKDSSLASSQHYCEELSSFQQDIF